MTITAMMKYLERLRQIDEAIQANSTGKPSDFAKKMCVSESTLYHYLSFMKMQGAPIAFCIESQSYIYQPPCSLRLGFLKRA